MPAFLQKDIPGCRRGIAHQWLGPSSPQASGQNFDLNWAEMEERHRLIFETHEEGKLPFQEYLGWVVFYEKRTFTRDQFRDFMFAQSKPYPRMIELITQLKQRHRLKIVVVSNESRAVNAHRIRAFKLDQLVDTFISSCFVHMRKPDAEIFRLALDLAQTPAEQVVFIDNTEMFVRIAEGLGMRGIVHKDYKSTGSDLTSFGLQTDVRGIQLIAPTTHAGDGRVTA